MTYGENTYLLSLLCSLYLSTSMRGLKETRSRVRTLVVPGQELQAQNGCHDRKHRSHNHATVTEFLRGENRDPKRQTVDCRVDAQDYTYRSTLTDVSVEDGRGVCGILCRDKVSTILHFSHIESQELYLIVSEFNKGKISTPNPLKLLNGKLFKQERLLTVLVLTWVRWTQGDCHRSHSSSRGPVPGHHSCLLRLGV